MLNTYKKISIIYGGCGRNYASSIKEELEKLHNEEHYPIYVNDLNTPWIGHNILGDVVSTIKSSDLIYIVFTLDDVGADKRTYDKKGKRALVRRLRQNVLIELGMALVVVGNNMDRIKFIANFKKSELGDDFPSDIRALSIAEFKDEEFDKMLESIKEYVRKDFGISPTSNILHQEDAIEDFENVFAEFDKINLYKERPIKKLNDILDLWQPAIEELTFPEEKLLYSLERIKALPIIGNGAKYVEWIKNFEKKCLPPVSRENNDWEYIAFVQDIAKACFKYTCIKTDPATEKNLDMYNDVKEEFEYLDKNLDKYLAQGVKFRPLILFLFHEYYGLTLMRLADDQHKDKLIDKIIEEYEECLEFATKIDTSLRLYEGYATFNLGRAHQIRYICRHDEKDHEKFIDYMRETLRIRKAWKEIDGFLQCYVNALSFEYFYASSDFAKRKKEIKDIDEETYEETMNTLVSEIDGYICKDSELSKLIYLKEKCVIKAK